MTGNSNPKKIVTLIIHFIERNISINDIIQSLEYIGFYLFTDLSFTSNEHSEAAFQYLKNNVDSYEEQKDNWLLCLGERKHFLKNHHIYEYLNLIPALKTQFGYKLLLLDFDVLYAANTNALYSVWRHFAQAVLKLAIQRGSFDENVLTNINGQYHFIYTNKYYN